MRLLIVDDDVMVLKALEQFLSKAGFNTIIADSGGRAVEILQNDKNFDLIITDIMMPEISGFSLLGAVREFESKHIPVILISSLDKAKAISTSCGLDVDDVIIKPIDFNELLLKITKLLYVKF